MTIKDLKLYAINSLALGISLTDLETILKIVLLLVTILYTIFKWYKLGKYGKDQ